MLGKYPLITNLPAEDLQRAINFYTKLGLKYLDNAPKGLAFFDCGNATQLILYERGRTKADHTAAVFQVDDIETIVEQLRSQDIKFLRYDDSNKNSDIVTGDTGHKIAWFNDSEGNILGLIQTR